MADNVVLNSGAGGETCATDDVAGVQHQVVKLADGTADSATRIAAGNGVAANSLRITLASDSTGVLAATQSGTWNVTNISGTVSLPTGASTAAKQPALGTAGTASADVISVQGIASMTPLLSAQSGTWNIGTVTAVTGITNALPAGTNNIGDVDVLTVNGVAPAFGTGLRAATVQRVTIATDDVVPVSQSGSWSLAANQSVNTAQINGVTVLMGNGASGTGAQRVTIANDSTGILAGVTTVTTVTTLSTLTGGAVAHDAADSGNPIKVGAKASATLSDDTMVANADRTDLTSDLDGAILMRPQFPLGDLISENVSNTNGTSTAFSNFDAVASTRSYITAYSIFRTDAGTTPIYVDFRDGTAGAILWSVVLPPNGGANLASPVPLFRTTANTALAFDVSAATTTVYINVTGFKSKV
jgi:hypothetical protein